VTCGASQRTAICGCRTPVPGPDSRLSRSACPRSRERQPQPQPCDTSWGQPPITFPISLPAGACDAAIWAGFGSASWLATRTALRMAVFACRSPASVGERSSGSDAGRLGCDRRALTGGGVRYIKQFDQVCGKIADFFTAHRPDPSPASCGGLVCPRRMFELISRRAIASFNEQSRTVGAPSHVEGQTSGGARELDTVGSARLPAASIRLGHPTPQAPLARSS